MRHVNGDRGFKTWWQYQRNSNSILKPCSIEASSAGETVTADGSLASKFHSLALLDGLSASAEVSRV